MRVMAIDLGDQRTGIAVSDPLRVMAGDAWTVSEWNKERLSETIAREVRERNVDTIILGYPLNMDGSAGERAEKSREFGKMLFSLTGIDPVLWDERRTTVDAHRILNENGRYGKRRKQAVDAVSATLILEAYLGSVQQNQMN